MQPSTHLTAAGAGVAGLPAGPLAPVVAAAWGLSALWRDRSLAAVWRQPPLLLTAAGGTVTLAALPVDAAWHASFGRDAVLWSLPHMLAVFGSLALLVGFLGGVPPDTSPWILTSLGALLALIIRQVRGPARTPPVPHAARTRGAATHGDGVGHERAPVRLRS